MNGPESNPPGARPPGAHPPGTRRPGAPRPGMADRTQITSRLFSGLVVLTVGVLWMLGNLGMIDASAVIGSARAAGVPAWLAGEIVAGTGRVYLAME